jgi:hypothetical protein
MQSTYTIEKLAAIAQKDRLAEARHRQLAQVAAGSRRSGFFASMFAVVRETLSSPSEDLTFMPKLTDYPRAAH